MKIYLVDGTYELCPAFLCSAGRPTMSMAKKSVLSVAFSILFCQ
jgi:hypothetical protein